MSRRPERTMEPPVSDASSPRDPLTILTESAAALARATDLDSATARLLEIAGAATGATMAAALAQDPDRPALQLVASIGMDAAAGERLAADATDPADPFATAVRERVADFAREARLPSGDSFTGAYLPLVVSTGGVDSVVGAVGFGWTTSPDLDDSARAILVSVADLIAVAMDRARLSTTAAERSEWFERLAHSDPLTGLANDRTIARVLELEIARAARQQSEVSVAVLDIDGFRETNEDGGRDAGDDVLRRVAAVLAESVRLVDTVGRIGGDEFILVAPGSAGGMVAQRIVAGIERIGPVGGRAVTASIGVARFPADGTDVETLVASAMGALAQAKTAGPGTVTETPVAAEG